MNKEDKATRLTLFGIGGLYNYGCEAIVRGTTEILRRAAPGANICYVTPRAEDDAHRIADTPISVVPLKADKRSLPLKVVNKIARAMCIPFDSTRIDHDAVLDITDVLISIGGDIYTIPAHMRERRRYPFFNSLVRTGEIAQKRDIPEIVIGASIGPFGDYGPAVDYYAEHLRGIDLICCREQRSIDYLAHIGIRDNVCFLPDPAFFVKGEDPRDVWDESEYLGVNLSPLSLRELSGRQTGADVARFAQLIQEMMDNTGFPVMLIPHVISPDPGDNDLLFLKKVAGAMDSVHASRTEVVEPTGFLDAKRYLRRCRLVVAARMHCAVNAMCEGVPTILLSYSQKSLGMCEYVYGADDWVLPLCNAFEELPSRLYALNANAENIHDYLMSRIADIRNSICESKRQSSISAIIRKRGLCET